MDKRQIIAIKAEELLPYNRYGKVSKGLKWLPLSKDETLEHEVFIIHLRRTVPQIYTGTTVTKNFMCLREN